MGNNKFNSESNKVNNTIIPEITYSNAYHQKTEILKTNKSKSGVYRLNNLITGKSYVGSSKNLAGRFKNYYSIFYLKDKLKKGSSLIYNSLLKHGHSNFSLDIIEYCEYGLLLKREQFYLDFFKPEYNILKIAGNRLGSIHSEATKTKMKFKASIALSPPLRKINHLLATGHNTTVINKKNNSVKLYESIRAAAIDLGTSHTSLLNYINSGKLYKDAYIITRKTKN